MSKWTEYYGYFEKDADIWLGKRIVIKNERVGRKLLKKGKIHKLVKKEVYDFNVVHYIYKKEIKNFGKI